MSDKLTEAERSTLIGMIDAGPFWAELVRKVLAMQSWQESTLKAADSDSCGFVVSVNTMEASNGTSYVVCVDRSDRPENAKPWDAGRWMPYSSAFRERAEQEADDIRKFLYNNHAALHLAAKLADAREVMRNASNRIALTMTGRSMISAEYFDQEMRGAVDDLRAHCQPAPLQCDHDWIDLRNEVIESGEMCSKCKLVRAGNAQPLPGDQCSSCDGMGSTPEVTEIGDQRVDCPDCGGTGKASKQITPPKLEGAHHE